jgi:hypothetical protein
MNPNIGVLIFLIMSARSNIYSGWSLIATNVALVISYIMTVTKYSLEVEKKETNYHRNGAL